MTAPCPPDSKQVAKSPSPSRPARVLAGACLVAALGLHWLVLSLKLPEQSQPEPTPVAEEASEAPLEDISITVLPEPSPAPAPPATAESPSPAPPPIQPAPSSLPPSSPPPPSLQPLAPASVATLPPPDPADQEPDMVEPEVFGEELPEPQPNFEPEPPEPSPYADFPHLAGAEATCDGVADCWRSPASSWRSASAELRNQLENAGYILTNVTGDLLSVDTGVRVYAVKQGEEVAYYLNLVSVAGGGILYTMTEEPITSEMVGVLQGD